MEMLILNIQKTIMYIAVFFEFEHKSLLDEISKKYNVSIKIMDKINNLTDKVLAVLQNNIKLFREINDDDKMMEQIISVLGNHFIIEENYRIEQYKKPIYSKTIKFEGNTINDVIQHIINKNISTEELKKYKFDETSDKIICYRDEIVEYETINRKINIDNPIVMTKK